MAQDWDNLAIVQRGKTVPHVNIIPYSDPAGIKNLDYRNSHFYLSLNGTWEFFYCNAPNLALPAEKLSQKSDTTTATDSISVPGNWELQGFGTPVYVNVRNEFPSNPPYPPTDFNPTGIYRRTINIPYTWDRRRVFIHFGAVKSACQLFVNGQEIGYSEDSKTPAEWEITDYVTPGPNRIVLKVYRWSTGSYLECQDMWRMSGITRDVFLYSTPNQFIRDFSVLSTIRNQEGSPTGQLQVRPVLSNFSAGTRIEIELRDSSGFTILQKQLSTDTYTIKNVHPWSVESPYLYTLIIRLYHDGLLTETIGTKVGFRSVEIANGLLCLNGKPITIRGVNRHEHSAYYGHYIPREEMEHDIKMMKSNGINAVRTSHYPNDPYWYELCDKYGMLVWDEANNESHAQGYGEASLAKNPDWTHAFIYRCDNMLQRDKNHPSVIVWSVGNECGNGICTQKAYQYLKTQDPTRPIAYERAELDSNTDIISIMYPSEDYLSRYARGELSVPPDRPYIMAEYCHAMGNSLGSLGDYWDTIDKYTVLQGGFIWDWVDQSFPMHGESRITSEEQFHNLESKGENIWYAVGGDLGELPGIGNDDAFCANGLVTSTRQPHAHLDEVRSIYCNMPTSSLLYQLPNQPSACLPQEKTSQSSLVDNLDLTTGRETDIIGNNHFKLEINKQSGIIQSFIVDGKEMLAAPIRWNFWRPPTLNDLADPNGAPAWEGLDNLDCKLTHYKVIDNRVGDRPCMIIVMKYQLTTLLSQTMYLNEIVEIDNQGVVQLDYAFNPNGAFRTLPKMGIQMGIDTAFSTVTFNGNRYETYPDRQQATQFATHTLPTRCITGETHIVPQETGNRQAEYFTLSATDGRSISITSPTPNTPINFSIRHFDDSTITHATRMNQLQYSNHYTLSVDHLQAGVGTATCGPGVRRAYQISGDSVYTYSFIIFPSAPNMPAPQLCHNHFPPYTIISQVSQIEKEEVHISLIDSLSAPEPNHQYCNGFPTTLTNSRYGVPGSYSNEWTGYLGADSLIFSIRLAKLTTLNKLSLSFCNKPADWVLAPNQVFIETSKNGKHWSPRVALSPNELTHRTLYQLKMPKKPIKAKYIKVIIYPASTLPPNHPYHGEKAWTMIDEISVQ